METHRLAAHTLKTKILVICTCTFHTAAACRCFTKPWRIRALEKPTWQLSGEAGRRSSKGDGSRLVVCSQCEYVSAFLRALWIQGGGAGVYVHDCFFWAACRRYTNNPAAPARLRLRPKVRRASIDRCWFCLYPWQAEGAGMVRLVAWLV